MDTIDWVQEYAPGFQALSEAERRAITEFLFLWSLFEAKVLNERGNANAIVESSARWDRGGQLTVETFGQELAYFRNRYVADGQFSYGRHWMALATTFDFLGFTHVWGRSMRGKDVVRQITAKGRFARALKSVHDWCKRYRHLPVKAQQDYLARVIRGHCAYFGLTGNSKRLSWFRYQVARIWRMWLSRRSRLRGLNWDRMNELLKRYPLPPVTITRSWQRFLSEPVR